MSKEWKTMPGLDKVLLVARIGLGALVFMFAALRYLHVMERGIDWAVPTLGAYLLIQAAHEWNRNRMEAIVSIVIGVFVLGVAWYIWFVR